MRRHVDETRVLVSNRKIPKRPLEVDSAAGQDSSRALSAAHGQFPDVARRDPVTEEKVPQGFSGIVEYVQLIVAGHQRDLPCQALAVANEGVRIEGVLSESGLGGEAKKAKNEQQTNK
jgi:hypothetical protein